MSTIKHNYTQYNCVNTETSPERLQISFICDMIKYLKNIYVTSQRKSDDAASKPSIISID